jgi:hypothetical protein
MSFRLLRVSPGDFDQLGFCYENKNYFDKCLPFGASISCALFEKFPTVLHWCTENRSGNSNIIHYLYNIPNEFLYRQASPKGASIPVFEYQIRSSKM